MVRNGSFRGSLKVSFQKRAMSDEDLLVDDDEDDNWKFDDEEVESPDVCNI